MNTDLISQDCGPHPLPLRPTGERTLALALVVVDMIYSHMLMGFLRW